MPYIKRRGPTENTYIKLTYFDNVYSYEDAVKLYKDSKFAELEPVKLIKESIRIDGKNSVWHLKINLHSSLMCDNCFSKDAEYYLYMIYVIMRIPKHRWDKYRCFYAKKYVEINEVPNMDSDIECNSDYEDFKDYTPRINKPAIKIKKKVQYIDCECGEMYAKSNKKRHQSTDRHCQLYTAKLFAELPLDY